MNLKNIEDFFSKFKERPVIMTALLLILCLLLYVVKPYISSYFETKGQQHADPSKQTNIGTAAFSDSNDIIIAQFESTHANVTYDISHRIEETIRTTSNEFNLNNTRIKVLNNVIINEEEATKLAKKENSKLIIWGWYDTFGLAVNITLNEEALNKNMTLRTGTIPFETSQIAGPSNVRYVIGDALPKNILFLSYFAVGHLAYLGNDFEGGQAAFDAATRNLPNNVHIENKALVHFFHARYLQKACNDCSQKIICNYSKALQLEPDFIEAYNNLGAFLLQSGTPISELDAETVNCIRNIKLDDISLPWLPYRSYADNTLGSRLLRKALTIEPNFMVADYNLLAASWNSEFEEIERGSIKLEVSRLYEKSPSLPGIHIMLSVLAFEDLNFKSALEHFLEARKSLPNLYGLGFNIGQAYANLQEYQNAINVFEFLAAQEPQNSEARIALSIIEYLQGRFEMAMDHLKNIPVEKEPVIYRGNPVSKLKTLVSYRMNDFEGTINVIESYVDEKDMKDYYLLYLLYILKGDGNTSLKYFDSFIINYKTLNSRAQEYYNKLYPRNTAKNKIEAKARLDRIFVTREEGLIDTQIYYFKAKILYHTSMKD